MIHSTVKTDNRTGVEIEALTGCSVAALTIFDMCKSIDKSIEIKKLKLNGSTRPSMLSGGNKLRPHSLRP